MPTPRWRRRRERRRQQRRQQQQRATATGAATSCGVEAVLPNGIVFSYRFCYGFLTYFFQSGCHLHGHNEHEKNGHADATAAATTRATTTTATSATAVRNGSGRSNIMWRRGRAPKWHRFLIPFFATVFRRIFPKWLSPPCPSRAREKRRCRRHGGDDDDESDDDDSDVSNGSAQRKRAQQHRVAEGVCPKLVTFCSTVCCRVC